MHVAYHIYLFLVGYLHPWNKQRSTSQTTSWCLSFFSSFLTCIIECVCEEERMTMDIECDWSLVLGHSYTGKYSVNLLQLVVVMCLFLSMVVWQPFPPCWRYIIARVSEMHVAYHKPFFFVVYLHPWNKQHSTSQRLCDTSPSSLPSFLTCIIECVCEGERMTMDIECDWRLVLGDSYTGRYCVNLLQLLLSFVCSSVWSFGSHLEVTGV